MAQHGRDRNGHDERGEERHDEGHTQRGEHTAFHAAEEEQWYEGCDDDERGVQDARAYLRAGIVDHLQHGASVR